MKRAKWKGSFLDYCLIRKKNDKKINVWSRRSVIPFFLIDKTVFVHNGQIFKKLLITRERVGYKFGEFIFTRTKPKHKKK